MSSFVPVKEETGAMSTPGGKGTLPNGEEKVPSTVSAGGADGVAAASWSMGGEAMTRVGIQMRGGEGIWAGSVRRGEESLVATSHV